MTTVNVTNSTQLIAALSSAKAGETIALAAGTYAPIVISGLKVPSGVTVTSANPKDPAVLTGIQATFCTGLTFTGLTFSTASTPISPYGASVTWSYVFNDCTSLNLSHLMVIGNPNGSLANTTSGIDITASKSVNINNNTFQYLHYGIQQTSNNGISIFNNSFSYLYDDAIRGGGTSNAQILNNTFTSMHMDSSDTDHPDCIQFWTVKGETASNITISGNTYTRGAGNPIQGVFIEDSIGGLPLHNVTITNNSFTGAGYNAITVMGNDGATDSADGVTIANNKVVAYADQPSWITVEYVDGGVVKDNTTMKIVNYDNESITLVDNTINTPIPLPNILHFVSSVASIASGGITASEALQGPSSSANTLLAKPAIA